MGTSLILAFDRFAFASEPILCSERHRIDWRDYELFDRIRADAVPLGLGAYWYDVDGLEEILVDPYGSPLTYLAAGTLARHLKDAPLKGFDAATRAYVEHLPPETKVVLYWC